MSFDELYAQLRAELERRLGPESVAILAHPLAELERALGGAPASAGDALESLERLEAVVEALLHERGWLEDPPRRERSEARP